ncbi:heavy metal translocating P-type ATPase [Pseudothermotoga thermarum]|uniref:Heavy metal translocating P-type ATPase n=1 Tax=Pseudothermotoga thermarum DSM 5069 TaxID=688269 RepID=F7YYQ8_9THEM|nr:heavy metal translocating P-type ATPase [Pseudothermotoga thermarum]AEH51093.1 heavy metal translocating P-type ATPase [Pseudothermotoga thermarum DSM 5069]
MRRIYKLKNLCCPNCARRIEETIKKTKGVKSVKLNFSLGILKVESEKEIDVRRIVKSIENEVEIQEFHQKKNHLELFVLFSSLLLFAASFAFKSPYVAIFSYIISGFSVFRKTVKNVFTRSLKTIFDEYFLMSIATIGALILKEYHEAAAVMVFYRFGEYLQSLAVNKSRKSIEDLINAMPKYAWLLENGQIRKISPDKLEVGQIILVKPGEKIPIDGIIVEGKAMVDTSLVTGESFPQFFESQQEVKAGFIVKDSPLKIKVTKRYEDSTATRLVQLVEAATERKSRVEKAITIFARYYTPIVLVVAFLTWLFPVVFFNQPFKVRLYRSLVLLVISCPCALMLAVPLTYFAGLGKASKNKILIKGADLIDTLAKAKVVLFDKTGTLTEEQHEIEKIEVTGEISSEQLLRYLASIERYSNHPFAKSIVEAVGQVNYPVQNLVELPGMGIKGLVNGVEFLAGNDRLLHLENVKHPKWVCDSDQKSSIHTAVNKKFSGSVFLREKIKNSTKEAIQKLKNLGITVKMLTGDKKNSAEKVAKQLGIEFNSDLLPEEKYKILENEKKSGVIIFVGDGLNDVPSLSKADVGIAMNTADNEAALEIADVVIADGEPIKVYEAIEISRKTRRIVVENIVIAIGVKILFILLATTGTATMWQGVFADVGVALLCVLNSMRILH